MMEGRRFALVLLSVGLAAGVSEAPGYSSGYVGGYDSAWRANPTEDSNTPPSSLTKNPDQVGPLPPGWAEYFDQASGLPYYHNTINGTTTWDRPVADLVDDVQEEVAGDLNATEAEGGAEGEPTSQVGVGSELSSAQPNSQVPEAEILRTPEGSVLTSYRTDVSSQSAAVQQEEADPGTVQAQPGPSGSSTNSAGANEVPTYDGQPRAWGVPEQHRPWGVSEAREMPGQDQGAPTRNGLESPVAEAPKSFGHAGMPQNKQQPSRDEKNIHQAQYEGFGGPPAQHNPPSGFQGMQKESSGHEKSEAQPGYGQPGSQPGYGQPGSQPPERPVMPQRGEHGSQFGGPQMPRTGASPQQYGGPRAPDRPHNIPVQQQKQGQPDQFSPPQDRSPPKPNQPPQRGQGDFQRPPQQNQYMQNRYPPIQQQPPQQQPSQFGPPGSQRPPMQQNYPYGQYGQYQQQYGAYGQPGQQRNQLVQQEATSAVRGAIGSAWQGLLGFGNRTKEAVGSARDNVVNTAKEASNSISSTSNNLWGQAKNTFGSFFEPGAEPAPQQNPYSLSGKQGDQPGRPGQGQGSYPQQQGRFQYPPQQGRQPYPPQQTYPPPGQGNMPPYPGQGQGQPLQGSRPGPTNPYPPQFRPPQPRADQPYPNTQQQQRQPPPQTQWGAGYPPNLGWQGGQGQPPSNQGMQGPPPTNPGQGPQPTNQGEGQQKDKQSGQEPPEAWSHPGLNPDF